MLPGQRHGDRKSCRTHLPFSMTASTVATWSLGTTRWATGLWHWMQRASSTNRSGSAARASCTVRPNFMPSK